MCSECVHLLYTVPLKCNVTLAYVHTHALHTAEAIVPCAIHPTCRHMTICLDSLYDVISLVVHLATNRKVTCDVTGMAFNWNVWQNFGICTARCLEKFHILLSCYFRVTNCQTSSVLVYHQVLTYLLMWSTLTLGMDSTTMIPALYQSKSKASVLFSL